LANFANKVEFTVDKRFYIFNATNLIELLSSIAFVYCYLWNVLQ